MAIEQRISVDGEVDGAVQTAREAREAARHAAELTAKAVRMLRGHGLSQRDTARLLGITPARVAQLDHDKAA
jgi:DNA-directed RNA polymerase specialized sigma24 family protein